MATPNPEERRIFNDISNPTCKVCKNSGKKEEEEPCVSCKWLTGNMGDNDMYEKGE